MSRIARPRAPGALALVLSLALLVPLLAACGDDEPTADDTATSPAEATTTGDDPTTTTAAVEFPVTIAADNGDVTIESRPERIISLSPTATEMLFAIGAGDQVAAVDDQSDYPPEAPRTDLSGFEPNVEAIAAEEPDLVVIADDSAKLTESLGALDITVVVLDAAASFEEAYAQVEALGVATGNAAAAADVADEMQTAIEAAIASVPPQTTPRRVYHELDPSLYSVTSSTFVGQVYAAFGLENIADAADEAGGGYPQLSAEYVVDADPQVVFLADTVCCQQTAETVAARPGWDAVTAVRTGAIVELDDDVASRWGPRLVDFVEQTAEALQDLEPAA